MIKVLIVDDERITRETLVKHIPWKELGVVEIREADDGINGYQSFIEFKPDIVVSDIKMPRQNGIEMAEKMVQSNTFCKFIFLSGYSDKEYLLSAIKLKVVRYVEKPIDIEEITQALRLAIKEVEKDKNIEENILPAVSNELCLALIHPNSDVQNIRAQLTAFGYDFPIEGTYLSTVIRIINLYDHGNVQGMDSRNHFGEVLKRLAGESMERILFGTKNSEYIILHYYCKTENDYVRYQNLLSNIKEELDQRTLENKYIFFIGVGSKVSGLEFLFDSYETAVIALKKCFFKERNPINYYVEDLSEPIVIEDQVINKITNYIKRQEATKAIIEIKLLIKKIKTMNNTHPEYIHNKFLQIIINLLRIAEDRNDNGLIEKCKESMNGLSKSVSIMQIEGIVLGLINMFFEKFNNTNDSDNITNINNFILEHYSEVDLSLNSIAENLFLSLNYLCFIYKKETGKTINQFITEVRIEKAKELLRTTETKLYHVAEKTGYQDGKYFSKVFTKNVGIKPKEYREMHRDE